MKLNGHKAGVRPKVLAGGGGCKGIYRHGVQMRGYAAELAEDGDEALRLIEQAPGEFAAVFLEEWLPRKNGLTVLREIRAINKEMPVFITSYAPSPTSDLEAIQPGRRNTWRNRLLTKTCASTYSGWRYHVPLRGCQPKPPKTACSDSGGRAAACGKSKVSCTGSAARTRRF